MSCPLKHQITWNHSLSFDVDALHNTLFWMKQIEHLPETSLNQQSTPCSPPVCGFNLSKRIEVLSNPAKRMCIQKCPKKKARSKELYRVWKQPGENDSEILEEARRWLETNNSDCFQQKLFVWHIQPSNPSFVIRRDPPPFASDRFWKSWWSRRQMATVESFHGI